MLDDINRFWIPIAQILPVFILGLVVEARLSLGPNPPLSPKKKEGETRLDSAVHNIDKVLAILYAAIFLIAMAALITAFVLSIAVLAGGKTQESSVSSVLVIAIVGALLTGLLPVARILESLILDLLGDMVSAIRRRSKTAGRHPKATAHRRFQPGRE